MWTVSSDYINTFTFDHLETYSLRRGAEYEQLIVAKPDLEYNGYIINEKGEFFPYSKKTNTFRHEHPVAERIKQILQIEIEEHLAFLCAPIYREAIVFYDQEHRIVSTLNICLSCFSLKVESCSLKADYKTFGYLKKLFLELGHNVENPHYNIIDDIEAMKQKMKKRKR